MHVIAKTKLRIRDQNELLNQISGTYKDFFRAAMEYIDNSVDAASMLQREGKKGPWKVLIGVDIEKRSVSFTDNCSGMTPSELCELLSHVGRSRKKAVSWTNGQFGFGVHAFRAFAREALFISRKKNQQEAVIKIDRMTNESKEVPCLASGKKHLPEPGTRVVISRFDPQVFKKSIFVESLAAEVEHHFDDVLRSKMIKVIIGQNKGSVYECRFFDYANLRGPTLKKSIQLNGEESGKAIEIDLKILERAQTDRLPTITNKSRRVQTVCDLKSYKNFVKSKGTSGYVWNNPFVVGCVEINDLCSPNLTRDDLKDSKEREELYEQLLRIQVELKELIDETMNKKTQESFKKVSSIMSSCLSQVLKNFKLNFELSMPSSGVGTFNEKMLDRSGTIPSGGGCREKRRFWE